MAAVDFEPREQTVPAPPGTVKDIAGSTAAVLYQELSVVAVVDTVEDILLVELGPVAVLQEIPAFPDIAGPRFPT